MIKYFHELTEEEFKKLVDSKEYTYKRLANDYPQPVWCNYPDATSGAMGCWSLMGFMVTGEDYCKNCDEYKNKISPQKKKD